MSNIRKGREAPTQKLYLPTLDMLPFLELHLQVLATFLKTLIAVAKQIPITVQHCPQGPSNPSFSNFLLHIFYCLLANPP